MPLALVVSLAASIVMLATAATRASQEKAAERIVALDPRWTVSFDTAPAAPAGYDQETSYVPLKGGDLVAVDLNQGTVRWKVALATSSTPATGDGLVFAAGEGVITALDQRTGQTQWRTPLLGPLASPLAWEAGWLFASAANGELLAVHGQDGAVVWRTALDSPLASVPMTSSERLYCALRDGRIVALELNTGALTWTLPLGEEVTGMLALNEHLIVGTRANKLHSISMSRGRVRWSQKAGADVTGAPVADEDHIYFAAFDNIVRALDRKSGNLRWLRRLPSRPSGGPLRIQDVVLVPLVTTDIDGFNAITGAPAFTIRVVGELGGLPFLRESARPTSPRLVAMSREGALQGFAPRFEPPPAPLAELPGLAVKGGH
jgi:outer membrane protein assembly factor BamB